ncbi:MAG TPA: hypothetical protein GX505_06255 [Clostridiales bacterium]|nr:hypothetical protein [Clostridiales bacterium]
MNPGKQEMTSRERALAVYNFQETDVPCFDLMEGTVWPELKEDFDKKYHMSDPEQIQTALGSDFRWTIFRSSYSPVPVPEDIKNNDSGKSFSDETGFRMLKNVETVAQVREIMGQMDPENIELPDFKAFRQKYPDKALICCPGWMPAFSGACNDFGMVKALSLMASEPEIIHEYVKLKSRYVVGLIKRCIAAGAAKYCDFLWLGDDFAGESSLLISPKMWRQLFKPALKEQVHEARNAGLMVMFHSCGDVTAVYEDFIEIGINAHIGVQTSCPDMSPEQLAAKIGGRLVIHGGVDAQKTLVDGDFDEVVSQTKRNLKAFSKCGGYVVSNSHHGMPDIGAEKIVAMSVAAGRWDFSTGFHTEYMDSIYVKD